MAQDAKMEFPTEIMVLIAKQCDLDTKILLRKALGWKPDRVDVSHIDMDDLKDVFYHHHFLSGEWEQELREEWRGSM